MRVPAAHSEWTDIETGGYARFWTLAHGAGSVTGRQFAYYLLLDGARPLAGVMPIEEWYDRMRPRTAAAEPDLDELI